MLDTVRRGPTGPDHWERHFHIRPYEEGNRPEAPRGQRERKPSTRSAPVRAEVTAAITNRPKAPSVRASASPTVVQPQKSASDSSMYPAEAASIFFSVRFGVRSADWHINNRRGLHHSSCLDLSVSSAAASSCRR